MVTVKKEGVILEPTELEFENHAVLNPACIKEGSTVHMFYRAVKQGGCSTIGYCKLDGPLKVVERSEKPVLFPEFDYEKHGVEDPRIVFLGGTYYLFYTAYDGKNARVAYAVSKDLKKWEKKGLITPEIKYNDVREIFEHSKLKERYFFFKSFYEEVKGEDVLLWEKDAFLFPRKFKGKFVLVHRILPDIQVIYFKNFKDLTTDYWRNYLKTLPKHIVLEPRYWFESRNIGGGCPPIETHLGWILIYHAVQDTGNAHIYRAGAVLLDKNNPCKVIGHLGKPLFSPEKEWELSGDVNNVVFPTGTAVFGKRLYIYYGAADKRIAVASVNLNELLNELINKGQQIEPDFDIGVTAGQVFNACLEHTQSMEQLQKSLHKDKKLIFMAIGWLAREGKIESLIMKDGIKLKTRE